MRCTSYAPKGRTYRAARSVVHNIGPPTGLGDAVKETNCSRREFLGMSVAAAGASLAAHSMVPLPGNLIPAAVAASDRVRFGMVGVGMQGNWLLSESIKLPGVECAAACDLYDGRHTLAREIVRADLPVTRRYQTLLEDKNIDCIVAAVPDHWHKQVVVDAVSAGKDIYCEKPMSHTPADGVAMVDAAKKAGRIVQIGSQRVSSQICAKAKELIAQGMLGDLMLVEGWLGRNDPTGAWQYPPPPDLSPRTLDWDTWQGTVPKRAFDPYLFARWRCWKEYGTGVAGDPGAVLLPATPAREEVRIERAFGHRALPGIPVQSPRREIGRRRILPRAGGVVASEPSFDEHQVTQHPLGDQLLGLGADLGAHALRADLHDASGLLRRVHHGHAVGRGVRHRLLAVDVLAGADRGHHHLLVPVIGNRRDDAVDVLVLEERLIAARDGQVRPDDLAGQRVPTVVEVSGRRTFDARQLYGLRERPVPLHAVSDHSEADPVTGRHGGRDQITGQRYHRVRSERCAGGSHAHAEKFTARTVGLFHGVSKARGWTDIMHHRPCGPIGSAFLGVAV